MDIEFNIFFVSGSTSILTEATTHVQELTSTLLHCHLQSWLKNVKKYWRKQRGKQNREQGRKKKKREKGKKRGKENVNGRKRQNELRYVFIV